MSVWGDTRILELDDFYGPALQQAAGAVSFFKRTSVRANLVGKGMKIQFHSSITSWAASVVIGRFAERWSGRREDGQTALFAFKNPVQFSPSAFYTF